MLGYFVFLNSKFQIPGAKKQDQKNKIFRVYLKLKREWILILLIL